MAPHQTAPDPQQAQVLAHGQGTLLVTGAAGTGKTFVLRERLARLIEDGALADRAVLVVRSRRDRAEARDALLDRLRQPLPDLRVETIHALSFRILQERFGALGYRDVPRVLSAADQFAMVRDLLAAEDPAQWPAYGSLLGLRGFVDEVRQFLVRTQEALVTPDGLRERAERAGLTGWLELAGFLRRYLDVLSQAEAIDFGGLVGQAALAVEEGDRPLDHLLVDDYQDATHSAEALLSELRVPDLIVAGNLAAHAFSFQGTTSEPLRRFAERFSAREVELDLDHRSEGRTFEAWSSPHSSEEHAAVARELRRVHAAEGVPWDRLAVVVRRQGEDLSGLLRVLDDAGVPRAVPESDGTLWGEPAVHPYALALRWIAQPEQRDALVVSVLTSELAGLSPAQARAALRTAQTSLGGPAAALDVEEGLTPAEADRLRTVREVLVRAAAVADRSAQDAFGILWRELPCSHDLVDRDDARALEAIVAFAEAVARHDASVDPSVQAFVGALEARADGLGLPGLARPRAGAVQVLTAHGAVGREFDTVIVVGAVEGNFPSLSRPEPMFDLDALEHVRSQSERNRLRLAEERRLFDLVVTRARRRVIFTAGVPRGDEASLGARSRFVEPLVADWQDAPAGPFPEPVSVAEAAALWRRSLADPAALGAERLASLDGLLALGVEPSGWWFQRDWTGTDRPLHEHIRVSASRLETLENCDLQFVLGEELGLGRPSGYHAWVGKLVHRLLDECEKGLIPREIGALVAEVDARWRPQEFPSKAISESFRALVNERMLPNWFACYGESPALAHEVGFGFELDGATVTGFIDRIGAITAGGNKITDFKTGNADRAPKAEESLQLGIYYLAAHEAEELARFLPVRGVELLYLKGHWKTGKAEPRAWQVGEGSDADERYQAAMRERLTDLIARVGELNRTEVYRPKTTADCWGCEFTTLCPLFPEGRPLFPVEA